MRARCLLPAARPRSPNNDQKPPPARKAGRRRTLGGPSNDLEASARRCSSCAGWVIMHGQSQWGGGMRLRRTRILCDPSLVVGAGSSRPNRQHMRPTRSSWSQPWADGQANDAAGLFGQSWGGTWAGVWDALSCPSGPESDRESNPTHNAPTSRVSPAFARRFCARSLAAAGGRRGAEAGAAIDVMLM